MFLMYHFSHWIGYLSKMKQMIFYNLESSFLNVPIFWFLKITIYYYFHATKIQVNYLMPSTIIKILFFE